MLRTVGLIEPAPVPGSRRSHYRMRDDAWATLGLGILLVTHDLGIAVDRSDRVVVMERGRVVEQGPVERIVRRPRAEYTQRHRVSS